MSAVSIAFFVLACLGTLYYILSSAALAAHFRCYPPPTPQSPLPMVSVLKPASGADSRAVQNFRSFLSQDYPCFEVLFGVLEPDDPAAKVIRGTIDGFAYASLRTGSEIDGSNNKVRILHTLARHASGDVMVITDADTRVTPDFLSRIIRPFADESIGAVTCFYRGVGARSTADALEGLHMTCVFAPGVAAADVLGGIDFGLGAAIAIRRSVLDEIGGFESIADYLADDFQLCHRAAKAGHRVVLSDYVIDIVLSGESLRAVLARELRWSRTTRVSRPAGHFGLVVTFGFAYALGFLIASRFSGPGWMVFGAATVIRAAMAWLGASSTGDREFPRRLHLLPLRDLLSFGIWLAGYLSNTVTWRGRKLRLLKDGRMVEGR